MRGHCSLVLVTLEYVVTCHVSHWRLYATDVSSVIVVVVVVVVVWSCLFTEGSPSGVVVVVVVVVWRPRWRGGGVVVDRAPRPRCRLSAR